MTGREPADLGGIADRLRTEKRKLVVVPSVKTPILRSPGFEKKQLAEWHLDLLGLCEYGCTYCSSNAGYSQRVNRARNLALAEEQLGLRIGPNDDPALIHFWPDVLAKLREQLDARARPMGEGQTLVFSMLTDGFSPVLLQSGFTSEALRLLVQRTRLRIRILTKNPAVASAPWITFFREHRDRVVVGLSIGTLDDEWAKRVERNVPQPSQRVRALHRLQDEGIATYGMLCPVFPHVLDGDHLERLVAAIRPERCETIWSESYNDRINWRIVQQSIEPGSGESAWLEAAFGRRDRSEWSRVATELYTRLRAVAERDGWLERLVYLLYEEGIVPADATTFADGRGVLLQSKPGADGLSRNPLFRGRRAP